MQCAAGPAAYTEAPHPSEPCNRGRLRRTVAVAVTISVTGARVGTAVEVAVEDSDVSVSVSVAASDTLRKPDPGVCLSEIRQRGGV